MWRIQACVTSGVRAAYCMMNLQHHENECSCSAESAFAKRELQRGCLTLVELDAPHLGLKALSHSCMQEAGKFSDQEFVQAFLLRGYDGRVRHDATEVAATCFVPITQVQPHNPPPCQRL